MIQANRDNSPVTDSNWSIQALKSVSLNGTTGNGAVGTVNLFTVTGAVLMRLFAKVVTAPGAASASTSPSSSASASVSPSSSVSASVSPSASASTSPSGSVSPSASSSGSPSSSLSPSSSASPSSSTSASLSPSTSISPSSSTSPSSSASPSSSVSASVSPSASGSPSASISPSSSVSPSPSSGTTQANFAVGTATNTTALITTTPAYLLVANRIWVDATPSTTVEPIASAPQNIVTENVIMTITTEAAEAGAFDFYCAWYPLSSESSVVAA